LCQLAEEPTSQSTELTFMARINLYGGAGCGKSTIAARIYSELKIKGYNIELVREYIKQWAYSSRVPKSFDQCYVFAKQLHEEDQLFCAGVEHIVTDSPMHLQVFYAEKYKFVSSAHLKAILSDYESSHNGKTKPINVFLHRPAEYVSHGRYETHEQAKQIDQEIIMFLDRNKIEYKSFGCNELEQVISEIEDVNGRLVS